MDARVLIVNNSIHRLLFRPAWHWKVHLPDVDTQVADASTGHPLPSTADFSHVLLTGSEASILEPKPWFKNEVQLIREAVEHDIPILGSCFGHQMLVYALSGSEYLTQSNPPEVGWADVEMTGNDELFEDLPNPWRTFVYHFDEAINPPAPWVKLGRTQHCDTHVLRYGDHRVWGIQAHPEISSRKARFFIRATMLMGRKSTGHLLKALRNMPPPSDTADRLVRAFLAQ